jgi:hypothetical protein
VISSRRRATRTETNLRDVPGVVTVLGAEELERRGVQSIRDVTRYEPGVTVGNQPARTGRSSYVIRGIGKNRVLVTVDGVRVPDFPSNAQPGTFTRDYLDLESIKAPRDHPRTRLLGRARALADAGGDHSPRPERGARGRGPRRVARWRRSRRQRPDRGRAAAGSPEPDLRYDVRAHRQPDRSRLRRRQARRRAHLSALAVTVRM